MIINDKHGNNHEFYFNNVLLDIVHQYKYLGAIFCDTPSVFKNHIDYVETVAYKAMFSVYGYLYSMNQTPPPISMKLCDSLVRPILEYGSEMWSICTPHKNLETLHLKFLKNILGVRPQTTTVAVYGELACYPLDIRFKIRTIKYWCKLVNKPKNSLPRLAYSMLFSLWESGFTTYLSHIYDILKDCNLEQYFEYSYFTNWEISLIVSQIKVQLQSTYVNRWRMEICSKPKLRTYCLFKNNFIMEDYLYVFNKRHRHALARLRTSAHTLEIERGRWCWAAEEV